MNRIIFLHGMSCRLDECWKPFLEQEFKKLGIKEIYAPQFPLLKEITLSNWESELDKFQSKIDENAILITHSLSTNFILKYLRKHNLKPKALICVAGGYSATTNGELDYLKDFIPSIDDFYYVRENIKNVYHIFSDNDDTWEQKHILDYNKYLQPVEIMKTGCAHFGRRSKVKEIPEIVEIVKNLIEQE